MAVILPTEHHAQFDPKFQDTEALSRLLVPYRAEEIKAHPVSTLVNNSKFEDLRCIEALSDLKPEGAKAI